MRRGSSEPAAMEAGMYGRNSQTKPAKAIGTSRKSLSKEIRKNGTLPRLQNSRKNGRFAHSSFSLNSWGMIVQSVRVISWGDMLNSPLIHSFVVCKLPAE